MNNTISLLRIIGTPFQEYNNQIMPDDLTEAKKLFKYAEKNKIGLLYLQSLKNKNLLKKYDLEYLFDLEMDKHEKQIITAVNICKHLNNIKCDYALFKSIFYFPATPNDVDIIIFNSEDIYLQILDKLPHLGYERIEDVPSPSEVMFHDLRENQHVINNSKDIFDIDFYREAGASHVIYLDKRKLRKFKINSILHGESIPIFCPEAELITIITHAIVPEQIITLLIYYATLEYLKDKFDLDLFLSIAQENEVIYPVKIHFSIIASLHMRAYGFVPKPVKYILKNIGTSKNEIKKLNLHKCEMPHKCSLNVIILILILKSKEAIFRKSLIKQIYFMLMDPDLMKWVIHNFLWRRKRNTY